MTAERSRTLGEAERRRLGAMMVASVRGRAQAAKSGASSRRDAGRGRAAGRAVFSARDLVPVLSNLPEKLGSSTALCAAMAGWGIGVALSLVLLEVVRW